MTKTTVKVQIPIRTNVPTLMALIYDESRNNQGFLPVSMQLLSVMKGSSKKYRRYGRDV